jgi:hypothetical protein
MVLLGDEGHVESCLVRLEIGARFVANVPWARTKEMELLGDELKWMLISVHLEIILILAHDKCTVCAERTIGSEIILDASDGTSW